jgi:hypothetical protein
MPPDAGQLRAKLAQHLDQLYRLEVIEAAEDVVRRRLLQLLGSELAVLRDDLASARHYLGTVRGDGDMGFIIEAEQRVGILLRQTTVLQRQTGAHIRASKRAHDDFLLEHGRLTQRIDQILRRLA